MASLPKGKAAGLRLKTHKVMSTGLHKEEIFTFHLIEGGF